MGCTWVFYRPWHSLFYLSNYFMTPLSLSTATSTGPFICGSLLIYLPLSSLHYCNKETPIVLYYIILYVKMTDFVYVRLYSCIFLAISTLYRIIWVISYIRRPFSHITPCKPFSVIYLYIFFKPFSFF